MGAYSRNIPPLKITTYNYDIPHWNLFVPLFSLFFPSPFFFPLFLFFPIPFLFLHAHSTTSMLKHFSSSKQLTFTMWQKSSACIHVMAATKILIGKIRV